MERKTAVGLSFILFLTSAWLIGNMINFQYDGPVTEMDLSYLVVIVTLLPFATIGIIFYKGRTRMFLFLFSFALFWMIFPVFFQAFAVLYFGILSLGAVLITLALMKGYINSKKVAVMTGFFLWMGGFIFYIYMDALGEALRSPIQSWPIRSEDLVEAPSYIWDEIDAAAESVGGPGILLLAFISILAIGFFTYQRFGQDHPFESTTAEGEEMEKDITSTVDRAITEIHQGKDVKSTILRCYQQMCLILEEKGVENEEFMTPREFENQATKKLSAPRSEISRIREIFEVAKYSSHRLGEEEKDRVLEDLKGLKDGLR